MQNFARTETVNDDTKGNRMFQIKKNMLKLVSAVWWVMSAG